MSPHASAAPGLVGSVSELAQPGDDVELFGLLTCSPTDHVRRGASGFSLSLDEVRAECPPGGVLVVGTTSETDVAHCCFPTTRELSVVIEFQEAGGRTAVARLADERAPALVAHPDGPLHAVGDAPAPFGDRTQAGLWSRRGSELLLFELADGDRERAIEHLGELV
jgi:hypothetical protein